MQKLFDNRKQHVDLSAANDSIYKYVLIIGGVLALSGTFQGRFQDIFRLSLWTDMVLGIFITNAWRALCDATALTVLGFVIGLHFVAMLAFYNLLPKHGYIPMLSIGLFESLLFCIPSAWIEVRYRRMAQR